VVASPSSTAAGTPSPSLAASPSPAVTASSSASAAATGSQSGSVSEVSLPARPPACLLACLSARLPACLPACAPAVQERALLLHSAGLLRPLPLPCASHAVPRHLPTCACPTSHAQRVFLFSPAERRGDGFALQQQHGVDVQQRLLCGE
jgi:hypothetical protein